MIWYGFLIGLIVLTETPVAINQRQINESSLVVAGSVAADGSVTIRQVFKGRPPENGLQLTQPPTVPPGEWILPLLRVGGRFEVTPSRTPNRARLVYPLTDDSIAQVVRFLP